MIINKENICQILKNLLSNDNLADIKKNITLIKYDLSNFKSDSLGLLNISSDGDTIQVNSNYIDNEINQILDTRTIERTRYYIERLIKGLSVKRTGKINDINLNRWKEYDDIITDSLWVLDKRDNSGAHNAGYWGNFIPQIPNQFLRRYTKQGDWILDTFVGSGTTLIECKKLGRNGVGIELIPDIVKLAERNIEAEKKLFTYEVITDVINGNCTELEYKEHLEKFGIKSFQFIIMHPPYWDIIKFSNNKNDLSNAKNLNEFLALLKKVAIKTYPLLENGRYCSLIIGDKYSNGEWLPLAFYSMQQFLDIGYKLKSTIVKNFDITKGKMNQHELWRYRALVGGFYIFKHEYIFLFQKV